MSEVQLGKVCKFVCDFLDHCEFLKQIGILKVHQQTYKGLPKTI